MKQEDVKERMESFGYVLNTGDEVLIGFAMQKVENTIKNDCNVSSIPDGLMHIAVDMVCGEFLFLKKTFAPNDLKNLDLDLAVKQIQKGDTNTVFAVGEGSHTPEQRLNAFVNYLLTYGRSEFARYRRLLW